MNTKFLTGIVVGALIALGGVWVYKSFCASCWSDGENTASQAQVGEATPNFALYNQDGQQVALSDYIEKGPVVLEWFNKDCPYVRKFYNVGEMQRLQEAWDEQGVSWLRVISSAPGKQGHLNQEQAQISHNMSAATHTLLDPAGDAGHLYGAQVTPHMYVIDGEGTLVYAGAIDSVRSTESDDIPKAENYVVAALGALKNGEPVETTSTEAYGCSIKYK